MEPETEPLSTLVRSLTDGAAQGRSEGACAVAVGIKRPREVSERAWGGATCLSENGTASPVFQGTLFDLASVTKLVTTLVAATLIDEGLLDLDEPVAAHLGPQAPDPRITPRQLLTHTSGLPPTMPLWRVEGGRPERLDAIGRTELDAEPGTAHAYSCIGFILLGVLLEHLTGAPLAQLARTRVLDPIGATTATYRPDPERCAATEVQTDPPRGLVQGTVHDETAWSLTQERGTAAGNAGLFGTMEDALALGRSLIDDTSGLRLSPATRTLLSTDQLNPRLATGGPWRQGLGARVGHALPGGGLAAHLVGHPGFTGCSILADPETGTVGALLTNRVHPDRERFTVARAREELAAQVSTR